MAYPPGSIERLIALEEKAAYEFSDSRLPRLGEFH